MIPQSISKLCFITGVLLCLVLLPTADSANIVFFSPVSSHSHRQTAFPLARHLAENNGHNVTYISSTTYAINSPKVLEYVPRSLDGWMEQWAAGADVFTDRKNKKHLDTVFYTPIFGLKLCEDIYKDEEFINWIKSAKVDLLVLDSLANDCAYGFLHIWKDTKVILMHTFSEMTHFTYAYGLSDESSWRPIIELPHQGPFMTFSQRLYNHLMPVFAHLFRKWYYFPKLEEITRQGLGITDLTKFEELEKKTALIYSNVHVSMEYPRSVPPNVVHIGGIALAASGKPKPLPKDLEEFVSKGTGFIVFSLGSWADFTRIDEEIQRAFIDTMKSFPTLQFVWKVSNASYIHEFPDNNVYISNWVPQTDLLAHPKIRGIMTQSGLISTQEAVTHVVPVIFFPFIPEQDFNAEVIQRNGAGIKMEITTVTKSELTNAINSILHDPSYKTNMKRISTLFKDRPQKPLDTAVWWAEYVLRHSHEDLKTLRPVAVEYTWWKSRGLDVWATVILSAAFIFISSLFFTWKMLQIVCKTANVSSKVISKQHAKKLD